MKTKSLIFCMIFLFSLSFALAQGMPSNVMQNVQTKTQTSQNYSVQEMLQAGEQFQYRYQFNCSIMGEGTECVLQELNEKLQFEVREQKRFLFFNVESIDKYELNQNGELIRARHNIWSRWLNPNKAEVE